ncbi:type II and III secretion system protein family protein [Oceanobacter kriegii]|uniref:type II and III secretion system protein family protein n=1 Tax=Oceanobacter kriegii TaxID=64972 RepID=UPI0003FD527F|nr:type II and III secretion system protein family protein [Oceanobacter kriegii]
MNTDLHSLSLRLLGCCALLLTAVASPATHATPLSTSAGEDTSGVTEIKETRTIELVVNQGRMLTLPDHIASILVADPDVASYQTPSARNLFVFGKTTGSTSLYAMDKDDNVVLAARLLVKNDLDALAAKLNVEYPDANIELESLAGTGVVVRGLVDSPVEVSNVIDRIASALKAPASGGGQGGQQGGGGGNSEEDQIVNQLQVRRSAQINIRVRVVEVTRSLSHELGMNWDSVFSGGQFRLATGNLSTLFDATNAINSTPAGQLSRTANVFGFTDGNTTAFIKALTSNGMASVLAEPNLTAMSGETAAFAAGGEVPVVVITANNVTIDFKSYGVILRMTPTLLEGNRISLHVAPEVSDLSEEGSVTLSSGSVIPAFKVRRAETTVEMASGQSFALAGMMRSTTSEQIDGVPGLSDIPLLGTLFDSETQSQEETELVIIATAYVVDPVAAGQLQVPSQHSGTIGSRTPVAAAPGFLF